MYSEPYFVYTIRDLEIALNDEIINIKIPPVKLINDQDDIEISYQSFLFDNYQNVIKNSKNWITRHTDVLIVDTSLLSYLTERAFINITAEE